MLLQDLHICTIKFKNLSKILHLTLSYKYNEVITAHERLYLGNLLYKCYVSALHGGDETMLHSVHIVIIWRMAISDIPVSIC